MRGISPVIATIIILAVTVAIAIAVVGWITGLWGGLAGGTEQLVIYPDSNITINTGTNDDALCLHVKNQGGDITIDSIEVVGLATGLTTGINFNQNACTSGTNKVIPAGSEGWVYVDLGADAVAGTSYTVKLYTEGGNVFTAVVQAKKPS